jgi:hypothetical protein
MVLAERTRANNTAANERRGHDRRIPFSPALGNPIQR